MKTETKRALIRRSLLSISLDSGAGMTGTCPTEAEFDRQCKLVSEAGYTLVDMDAHDAATGRRLPSDAWAWKREAA